MAVFQVSMGEKMRPLMEAVVKHCPNFEFLATTCLVKAKKESGSYDKTVLPGGARSESEVVGNDHLFGDTPERVATGKKWVDELVMALKADGFTCRDMCKFTVYMLLATLWNGANLRDGDILHLRANTAFYRNDVGRFVIRPPDVGKQTKTANTKLKNVLKQHEIHGAGVVQWCQMMSLVVRPFLEKQHGAVAKEFRPLGPDGKELSDYIFKVAVRDVGRAYFEVDNLDIYSLRTSQTTMAYRFLKDVGLDTTHGSIQELSREQMTSDNPGENTYNMAKYDVIVQPKNLTRVFHCKGGMSLRPLMIASAFGSIEVVNFLLQNGAEMEHQV
ncbi:unnamed protein product [Ectocarpus sp. 12 AP-2014]